MSNTSPVVVRIQLNQNTFYSPRGLFFASQAV